MKALVAIAALLAAVSFAMIGCSDGGSDRAEPAPTQPPAVTEAPATTPTTAPAAQLTPCGRDGETKVWVPAFLSSTKVRYCLPVPDTCGTDEDSVQCLLDNFNEGGDGLNPNGWQLKPRTPSV